MIPGAILLFLIGAVLAWAFRVWILIPVTAIVMIATVIAELTFGASLPTAFVSGLQLAPMSQLGYAFGLLTRYVLGMLGSPRSSPSASLNKRRFFDQIT